MLPTKLPPQCFRRSKVRIVLLVPVLWTRLLTLLHLATAGSRAVTFNLPPPPERYDTNSQIYKDAIKNPVSVLKLFVQHYPSVVTGYERQLETSRHRGP